MNAEYRADDGGSPQGMAPCWSCQTQVAARAPFCHGCGVIQPPRPLDHFARLNLQPTYDLSRADLERQYFGLQRYFHPDRFAARSSREKALSLQHATALNEAYETLKTPLKRAEYLLRLRGHPVRADGQETIDDPELLMEAMEMREELAGAADATAIEALVERVETDMREIERGLGHAFAAAAHDEATALCLKLRYRARLLEEAKARLRRLDS